MSSFDEIPMIDLRPLFQCDNKAMLEVVEDIREVFTKIGFAYIYNHGFSEELIKAAFKASSDFHELALEEKMKIKLNRYFRGYIPAVSSTLKISSLGQAKKPNMSEGFILANEVDESNPDYLSNTNLAGPNQWPHNMPFFKKNISEYNKKMKELAMRLVKVFSLAFGLGPDELDSYFTDPTTFLRLQYYPEQPDSIPNDLFGSAPHTDYGFLTILAQDNRSGLQVRNVAGDWINAPPIPGTFILNSGDMLKRLSNDTFVSTPHRVVNRSVAKRFSIPFFLEPNMHAKISPLPIFCKNQPPKYEAIEYRKHLLERIKANYQIEID
jgi:isopenicillin N synthase-like dioxygenase